MKKTKITGIFAVLLITAAMIAACTNMQEPDNTNAVITYKFYGGFIMPAYTVQELVVTKDNATFTVMAADGNITERFEKNLTREQYNAIITVFTDNNFASFGDRYDEGQKYVTDVGFTDITFAANGKTKTVTTYNVNDYMPAGLIRIREKLQETVEFTKTPDESQVKALAEAWIKGAPTYKYDGSGLTLLNYVQMESYPVRHVLTYTFTSSHAGYGDRSGTVTAQVITEHSITITIIDRTVDSAVIDGNWDEKGQFIIGSELSLAYRPKMCEKTPWQVWEENSGRVYIRAPTDEEIIKHYYSAVYSIDVREVKKIQIDQVSCQACDVCLETYRFGLTVNASDMQPLLDEGWTRFKVIPPAPSVVTSPVKVPLPGTAQNSERQVTVNSASKGIAYKYGEAAVTQVEYAKTGYTFVFVRYDVKNIGPDTITVSGGDFSIRDPEGTRYNPIMNKGTGITSGSYLKDLDTNQSIYGTIDFEVPLTAKNLAVYYDFGNVSTSIRLAYWNID
jgi:Domain of unknown function (DUF4352)